MTFNEYLVVGLYGLAIFALMIRVCFWDLAPREETPTPAPAPLPSSKWDASRRGGPTSPNRPPGVRIESVTLVSRHAALNMISMLRPVDVDAAPADPATPVDEDDLDALWAQATRAWRMAPGRAR